MIEGFAIPPTVLLDHAFDEAYKSCCGEFIAWCTCGDFFKSPKTPWKALKDLDLHIWNADATRQMFEDVQRTIALYNVP